MSAYFWHSRQRKSVFAGGSEIAPKLIKFPSFRFGGDWVIPLLLVLVIAAVNHFGLLQIEWPQSDYSNVEVARYVLKRWPNGWNEVKTSCQRYSCNKYEGDMHSE